MANTHTKTQNAQRNKNQLFGSTSRASLGLLALEPRVLLDAAGVVTGVEGAVDVLSQQQADIAGAELFTATDISEYDNARSEILHDAVHGENALQSPILVSSNAFTQLQTLNQEYVDQLNQAGLDFLRTDTNYEKTSVFEGKTNDQTGHAEPLTEDVSEEQNLKQTLPAHAEALTPVIEGPVTEIPVGLLHEPTTQPDANRVDTNGLTDFKPTGWEIGDFRAVPQEFSGPLPDNFDIAQISDNGSSQEATNSTVADSDDQSSEDQAITDSTLAIDPSQPIPSPSDVVSEDPRQLQSVGASGNPLPDVKVSGKAQQPFSAEKIAELDTSIPSLSQIDTVNSDSNHNFRLDVPVDSSILDFLVSNTPDEDSGDNSAQAGDDNTPVDTDTLLAELEARPNAVVFVDTSVQGYETILAQFGPDVEIVLIDANEDGIEKMAAWLSGRESIDAIHIISHGSAGHLNLGNSVLDSDSIAGEYADELAIIGQALSEAGDILIYGCNFGADAFAVNALARATGADIAASDDDTGATEFGADWDLEVTTGDIETRIIAADAFRGILADSDGDGIDDAQDIDDDNDGILDVDEGFIPPGINFLSNSSFEQLNESAVTPDGAFFGGGFGEFGNDVFDWDLVSGTADVFYLAGAQTINGTAVPQFLITDIGPFAGLTDPGPSDGLVYGGLHSGDGLLDAPNELARGRETVINNLVVELQAGTTYTFTIDVYQADGLVSSGRSGGLEFYTIDTGAVPDGTTAYQDGTVIGGLVNNVGANGIKFVGLSAVITADGTAASGTAANGTPGWQTLTFTFTPTTNIDRIIFTPESGLNIYYAVDNLQLFTTTDGISRDTDGDGVGDQLDRDSDNDGISDLVESGASAAIIAADTNNDGSVSIAEAEAILGVGNADVDGDGLLDIFDADIADTSAAASVGTGTSDFDNDGVDNVLDLDSDNDGIPDAVEAQPTTGYISPTGPVDANGVNAIGLFVPVNTDGADNPDYLDTDSDNDSVLDSVESGLTPGADNNGDGIGDNINASYVDPDGDINDPSSDLNNQTGDTSEVAFRELPNTAPVAVDDQITVTAGTLININPLGNDNDADSNPLVITHIIDPANPATPIVIGVGSTITLADGTTISLLVNGSLDVTPPSNMGQKITFDYSISDGNGGSDTATVTLARDIDGDGIADIDDLDDDNDGILDIDEGQDFFTVTLDQVSALPPSAFISGGGVVPDGVQGLRLSDATGQYFIDLYEGPNSSPGAAFTFDTVTGRIQSTAANLDNTEVVEIVYTTLNSPNPFDLTTLQILDIDSLTSPVDEFNVRDAYVWSEAGTWTPLGSPAGAVISVNPAAPDGVGNILINDPDGNNVIGNVGSFSQVLAIDGSLSDVLTNLSGASDNHNVEFTFDNPQTTASLFAFNSGGGNMFWGLFPQLDVQVERINGVDTDGDGIANQFDLDSDNDGIADIRESGASAALIAADTNNDGTISLAEAAAANGGVADADGDGLMDIFDANIGDTSAAASIGTGVADFDSDSVADVLDLDSDNDGIADTVEARPTAGFTSNDGDVTNNDADGDGIIDIFDNNDGTTGAFGGSFTTPENTDGVDNPDYLDTDSDNDTIFDSVESGLTPGVDGNGDGIGDGVGVSYADPDGDVNNPSADLTNQTGDTSEVAYREDNTAPVAVNDTGTTDEDTVLNIGAAAGVILGNDTDVDGDMLSVSAVNGVTANVGTQITLASGALLTLNADGSYDYDPNGAFEGLAVGETGTDTFIYTVSDGNGGTDTATVTITINGVNDAPTAADDVTTINEEATLSVLAANGLIDSNDTDPDASDVLTITEVNGVAANVGTQITLASGALLTVNADGSYDYDPNGVFNALAFTEVGVETFTYMISDGHGGTDTATVTINIFGVNDAPTAADDAGTTDEDTVLTTTAAAGLINPNDTDPDTTDVLVVNEVNGVTANVGTQITLASGALLTVNADGSYSYDPNGAFDSLAAGATGTDTFSYTVSDGNGGTDTATVTITINGVNDAPVAVNDTASTDEDTAISVTVANGVLPNDTDAESDPLMVSEVEGVAGNVGTQITLASGALLTLNADGSYDYDPNGVFEGLAVGETATDTFTYTVSDGNGGTDTATVTLTINGVNDAPMAADDANSTDEDTVLSTTTATGLIDPNDTDPDASDILFIGAVNGAAAAVNTQITLPSGALLTVNRDGSYDYDPNGVFESLAVGETGMDTFTYTVSDGNGGTDTATVTLTINGVNDAPTAVNDTGITDEDTVLTTTAATGLIDPNDTDPDTTDVLTVSEVEGVAANVGTQITLASGALLTVNADGSYSYDPNGVFEALAVGTSTTDTFSYTVSDGNGGTDTATVTLTIDGVNDAPIIVDPANPGIPPMDPNNIIPDVVAVDGETPALVSVDDFIDDPDGDVLTFSAVGLPAGLTIDPASGIITGTIDPSASQGGTDPVAAPGVYEVVITAVDPSGEMVTTTLSYTITNPAPIAQDDFAVTDEDNPTAGNVIMDAPGTDTDAGPDSDILVISEVEGNGGHVGQPVVGSTGGTFVLNVDGSWTFDPGQDFGGLATGESRDTSITYQLSDGEGGFDTAVLTVTVDGVNDTPNIGGPIIQQAVSDGETIAPVDTASSFNNPAGEVLTFSATNLPVGLTINPVTGEITGTVGSDASLNGVFVTVVTASTPTGESASATVVWTVSNVDPDAVNDTSATALNTPVTLSPLTNDQDGGGDNDVLTITGTTPPTNGVVVVNPDGTITYTPNPGFSGTDTFDYTVDDGQGGVDTATITIVVDGVAPGAPVATPILPQALIDGETIVPIDISGSFTDPDGDPLSFTQIGLPQGLILDPLTGIISGTVDPDASEDGPYSVIITATDPLGNQISETLILSVSNPGPIAVQDSADTDVGVPVNIAVIDNDSDPDGDALHVALIQKQPSDGVVVIHPDGTITYTPNAGFTGTDSFSYILDDGNGGRDEGTVTINVGVANPNAPTSTPLAPETLDEGALIAPIDPSVNFVDPNGDPLTFSATGLPPGLIIDPNTGVITGTPENDASVDGPYTVLITATDPDGNQTSEELVITVNNPGPVAMDDAVSAAPASPVVIAVQNNDSDPDGDAVTVTGATAPANGMVVVNPDGTITYTANVGFIGTDSFNYTITDAQGGTDTATVTITVTDTPIGINPDGTIPPVFADDSTAPAIIDASNFIVDPDGDVLTFAAIGLPAGLVIDPASGLISGTLNSSASQGGPNGDGVYLATITGTDPSGEVTMATIMYTVSNPAPIAQDDAAITDENVIANGNVFDDNGNGVDADPDGDTFTVSEVDGDPANLGAPSAGDNGGSLSINADGSFSFDPGLDFDDLAVGETRDTTITYTIEDADGGVDTATITLTVQGVNDAPTANDDIATTDEDTVLTTTAATGLIDPNDTDPDTTDILTVSEVNGVAADVGTQITLASGALLTVSPDGSYSYDPNGAFEDLAVGTSTTDSFMYTVSDGNGGTDTATVTLTIDGVNDTPNAVDDAVVTNEDTAISADAANGLINPNDTDPDLGDVLVVSEVNGNAASVGIPITLPSGALLRVNPDGSYDYSPNGAFEGLAVGELGADTFTYTVSDGNGGTDTATVTVSITGVNDAPVANDDAVNVSEGNALSVPAASGLIETNDIDLDVTDVLTVSQVNGVAANVGTQITLPSGALLTVNPDGSYDYDPNGAFEGLALDETDTDSFVYTVSDGHGGTDTATVVLTINGANDVPVPVDPANPGIPPADPNNFIPSQNGEDSVAVPPLDLTTFFEDPNAADVLTITVDPAQLPPGLVFDPATGIISGTPDSSASQGGVDGVYEILVTVTDNNGGEVTTTIVYTLINPEPIAQDDGVVELLEDEVLVLDVLANDNDPDDIVSISHINGQAVNVGESIILASGARITLLADGNVEYSPAANANGADSFTYTIVDTDGASDTAQVDLNVVAQNDEPILVFDLSNQTGTDGQPIDPIDLLGNFTDQEGDVLSFSATDLPPGLTIDPNTGIISGTLTSDASVNGPYTVAITVDDGQGGVVTETFVFTVDNIAPILEVIPPATTNAGEPFTLDIAALSSDPDGDALNFSATGLPDGLSIDPATGIIFGTPTIGSNDPFNVVVSVSDGQGGTVDQTFELTVLADDLFNPIVGRTDILPLGADGIGRSQPDVPGRGSEEDTLRLHDLFVGREPGQSLHDVLEEFDYNLHGGMAIATRISGLGDQATMLVEGVAGPNSIYVQLSETISEHTNSSVTNWQIEMVGGVLPDWVDFDPQTGFLVINRSLNVEAITLRIQAVLENGQRVGGNFEIDLRTGEVELVDQARVEHQTLSQQMAQITDAERDRDKALLDALSA